MEWALISLISIKIYYFFAFTSEFFLLLNIFRILKIIQYPLYIFFYFSLKNIQDMSLYFIKEILLFLLSVSLCSFPSYNVRPFFMCQLNPYSFI